MFTSKLKELKKDYFKNDIIFIEKESTHTVGEQALSGKFDDSELINTILVKDITGIEIMGEMWCSIMYFFLISCIPVILLLVSANKCPFPTC